MAFGLFVSVVTCRLGTEVQERGPCVGKEEAMYGGHNTGTTFRTLLEAYVGASQPHT